MKIAVIGSTQGTGFELVKQALADGHEVTALVRAPEGISLSDPRLRVIKGDATDPASVAKIVEGQDVICVCLGTKSVTKKVTFMSRSAEILAEVLKPEQLLITITGIGTGDSKGSGGFLYDRLFLPIVLRRQYADKDRVEKIIKDKVNRWVIVRPGFLTNGPRTGQYRALTDLTGVHGGRISRADVADFMLAQAKSPTLIGRTPLLIY